MAAMSFSARSILPRKSRSSLMTAIRSRTEPESSVIAVAVRSSDSTIRLPRSSLSDSRRAFVSLMRAFVSLRRAFVSSMR